MKEARQAGPGQADKVLILSPTENDTAFQIVRPPCRIGRHNENKVVLAE